MVRIARAGSGRSTFQSATELPVPTARVRPSGRPLPDHAHRVSVRAECQFGDGGAGRARQHGLRLIGGQVVDADGGVQVAAGDEGAAVRAEGDFHDPASVMAGGHGGPRRAGGRVPQSHRVARARDGGGPPVRGEGHPVHPDGIVPDDQLLGLSGASGTAGGGRRHDRPTAAGRSRARSGVLHRAAALVRADVSLRRSAQPDLGPRAGTSHAVTATSARTAPPGHRAANHLPRTGSFCGLAESANELVLPTRASA